ncbi:hypothetical protein ACVCNR_00860 [Aquamicrobium terrae]
MARYAVIDGTTVENIIEAEEGFELPRKLLVLAAEGADIGGTYEDGVFTPPPPPPTQPAPVPDLISRRQFYQGLAVAEKISTADALAAIKTGTVPTALQAMLDAMTDPGEQFAVDMLLSGAGEFSRSHPLVMVFAIAQSMSEQDVDDFWRLCAAL